MRTDSIGYWKDKKEKLLKKYKNLTDKDLCFDLGKEKEMLEILGYKLGKTDQELLTIIVTI
jgi:thiamine pyrophosphokinase